MNIHSKLLSSNDHDNQFLMIARGCFDAHAVKQIITEVATVNREYVNCKVLIDLIEIESKVDLGLLDILFEQCARELPSIDCKIALVSSLQDGGRLFAVSEFLAQRGLRVALFNNVNGAVDWLAYKK